MLCIMNDKEVQRAFNEISKEISQMSDDKIKAIDEILIKHIKDYRNKKNDDVNNNLKQ